MKIDLHVHTSDWSDGRDCAADVISAAIQRGLDGIVITDHHRMLQPEEQIELQKQFPGFGIFRGSEISIGHDHVNLIGGTGEQITEERPYTEKVIKDYCEKTGAFSMLNHPFWGGTDYFIDFNLFCPEAMDIISMNVDSGRKDTYMKTAEERNMILAAASDAHKGDEVGMFHVDLDNDIETDEELVKELRAGRLTIATFDDMFENRVKEISSEEDLARKVIAEGGSKDDYTAQGGTFAYERVASGGSFLPPKEFIGMRGDTFLDK